MSGLKRKLQRAKQREDNRRGQRIMNATPDFVTVRRRVAGVDRADGWDEDLTRPVKMDKGQKGGSCNRRACQKPGADWFNHSTQAYYCGNCAAMLNYEANRFRGRDSFLDGLGHDLCTRDLPEGSHPHA